MKKYVSILFLLIFTFSISIPSLATKYTSSTLTTCSAQIYHAVGVDMYGSNIYDSSEKISNVPVYIRQDGGNIELELTADNYDYRISATATGKSLSENLIYFNITELNQTDVEVMSMHYIKSFSHGAVASKEYANLHPEYKNVLAVYLKIPNSSTREYYFIEIFDFEMDNFNFLVSEMPTDETNSWVMEEFQAYDRSISEQEISTYNSFGLSKIYEIKDRYYQFGENLVAAIKIEKTDDFEDVPRGGTAQYLTTIRIVGKYIYSQEAPEFITNNNNLSIGDARLDIKAPTNCGFLWTQIDGQVHKPAASGALSAYIGVTCGPLSASVDIGKIITGFGTIKINETFKGYINDAAGGKITRAISVDFNKGHWIENVGDYYQVLSCVRDYGNVRTSKNHMDLRWTVQLINGSNLTESINGTMYDFYETCVM